MEKFIVIVPTYVGSGRPHGPMRAVPATSFDYRKDYYPTHKWVEVEADDASTAIDWVWDNLTVTDSEGMDQWR